MGLFRPALICLVLALAVMQQAAGDTKPTISETKVTVKFYVRNVKYNPQDKPELTPVIKAMVESMMNKVGGEISTLTLGNGNPCLLVFAEWTGAKNVSAVTAILRDVTNNGITFGGMSYDISFNSCQRPLSTSSPPTTVNNTVELSLYVSGLDWENDFTDMSSTSYQTLKLVVTFAMAELGGSLRALRVAKNLDCVQLYIVWDAKDPSRVFPLIGRLKKEGLTVPGGSTYGISDRPCRKENGDKDSCPHFPKFKSDEGCGDRCNATFPCPEGFKCCDHGCGKACTRVGFSMSLGAQLAFDLPWLLSLRNNGSKEFSQMKQVLSDLVKGFFVNSFIAMDVHHFAPFHNRDFRNGTVVSVTIFFSEDLTNAEMSKAHMKLIKSIVPYQFTAYKVIEVQMGMDGGMCGDSYCEGGFCKHYSSGQAMCSCNEGRMGQGCNTFDCRKDFNSVMPDLTKNHCSGHGQCRENDQYEYKCECDDSFYGETCQYKLCDYLIEPCQNSGVCTGRFDKGEICSCSNNHGGLFCEEDQPDPKMTPCELQRRMMTFVHEQVTGKASMLDSMTIPMRKLLSAMGMHTYPVPYCQPLDNPANPGGFYSECLFTTDYGMKENCSCMNMYNEPNYYTYVNKDDCRVFNQGTTPWNATVYILNTAWNDDMKNMSTDLYTNIRSQIENALVGKLGGAITSLKLQPRGSKCVEMHVNMLVENYKYTREIMNELENKTFLSVLNVKRALSLKPCKKEIDINSCPEIRRDEVSICVYECSSDSECSGSTKCCPLACGGGKCVEIGYLQKVTMFVVLSAPYRDAYDRLKSAESQELLDAFSLNIYTILGDTMPGFLSLGIENVTRSSNYLELSGNMTRTRRDANQDYVVLKLVLKFNQEIDVSKIMATKENIMKLTFTVGGQQTRAINILTGIKGPSTCGWKHCHKESVCVDAFGEGPKCVCPAGRSGSECWRQSCFDMEGESICQNGGRCRQTRWDESFCDCPSGTKGQLCEVKICDMLKPDACNTGKCSGALGDAFTLCKCPWNKSGLFCEIDARPQNMTTCQRFERLSRYALSVLRGDENNDKLNVPMATFLQATQEDSKDMFSAPTCRNDNFYYICQYDIKTGAVTDNCTCVDRYGQPNYYIYENESCIVHMQNETQNMTESCDDMPCHNGGWCETRGPGMFKCHCQMGYSGKYCGYKAQCDTGLAPLRTPDGMLRSCGGQACPFGFDCQGSMEICCLNRGFLCQLNLCKNGGSCAGDIYSGKICHCPSGKTGLFCEQDSDGVELTDCQVKQRFYSWVMGLLRGTRPMPAGTNKRELQNILSNLEMTYFLEGLCDKKGEFNSKATGINIFNMTESHSICIDSNGNIDVTCKAEICNSILDTDLITMCQNGGQCVGDLRFQLCDCYNTGYHGVICEKPGAIEGMNISQCEKTRDIAEFAISLLNGSRTLVPNLDTRSIVKNVLQTVHSETIFVPACNAHGDFAHRGCVHMMHNTTDKECFCSTMDGNMIGNATSHTEPPHNCTANDIDNPDIDEDCPKAWGPYCIQPDWWCSDKVQCRKGLERCYKPMPCDGDVCYERDMEHHCVPNEIELPCDMQPCPDNPYKMCPPCGEHGRCINIKREYRMKDDNDSGEKKKGDDNDSLEKRKNEMAEEKKKHDDNDSEEKKKPKKESGEKAPKESGEYDDMYGDSDKDDMSWPEAAQQTRRNYMCRCPPGRSGENCEINNDICKVLPKGLCDHGCIGDLPRGILCRCPKGFSGLLCNKRAHSLCERKKRLYDDALDILEGKMGHPKYNTPNFRRLVQHVTNLTGDPRIPRISCNADGVFEKVQCYYNIFSLNKDMCSCVNSTGDWISSNTKPYLDFPVCTGPADYSMYRATICPLRPCLNGGKCVLDIYNGKICECPNNYHGLFCQLKGPETDKPVSLCSYMADSFETAHRMAINQSVLRFNVPNSELYFRLTMMLLDTQNRTSNGTQRHLMATKADCNADGSFKPYMCDANLVTKKIIACYCTNHKGPIVQTEAPDVSSLQCDADQLPCHELDRCPKMHCEHGHRTDLNFCPICECRSPCEGIRCMKGHRCVVKHDHCNKYDRKMCSQGVCLPTQKPGLCPGHDTDTYSSIIGGALENLPGKGKGKDNEVEKDDDMELDERMEEKKCRIECVDDADCEGNKKCCGLCGNRCMSPKDPESCEDHREMAMDKMKLIIEARKSMGHNMSMSLYMTVYHLMKTDLIWVPKCDGKRYKTVQCKFNVTSWKENSGEATDCFCVDRRGNQIKGSKAYNENDSGSCQVKPYKCPAPNPMDDEKFPTYVDECEEDMDCANGDKCCSNGVKKVCSHSFDAEKLRSTIDVVMQKLCTSNPGACMYGSCTEDWGMKGEACKCPSNRKGPFCAQPKPLEERVMTICQKKRYALEIFNASMQDYRHSVMKGHTTTELKGILSILGKHVDSWDASVRDRKYADMSLVNYRCDKQGDFLSTQCVHNVHTGKMLSCFCADANGNELLGTRKPAGAGKPHCGEKESMCRVGNPLHDYKGNYVTCAPGGSACPNRGYACTRSMYGKLVCCLSKFEHDVCEMPWDMGNKCNDQSTPETRYRYDSLQSRCKSFQYKGCGGTKNNFLTMEDCEKRCKDKIHLGECPNKFLITQSKNCKDVCASDSDCPSDDFKCCKSSCGKRCVPSVTKNPQIGKCPFGRSSKKMCYRSNSECEEGYFCHKTVNNPDMPGTCCANANVNLCYIKPPMELMLEGEDMWEPGYKDSGDKDSQEKGGRRQKRDTKKDSQEEKDKKHGSEDKDKHSSDKDSGEYEDMEKFIDRSCDDPRPRYYYNKKEKKCNMFYGCDTDFNTFKSMEDCCQTCSSESRCKPGGCPKVKPSALVFSCTDECSSDNECKGRQICCSNGCAKTCQNPKREESEEISTCDVARMRATQLMSTMERGKCSIHYVPSCDKERKAWDRLQCNQALGTCWCVTDLGNYIANTMTKGVAYCDNLDTYDMKMADVNPQNLSSVNFDVCPKGKKVHCCNPAMCNKKCRAHPEAMCRINPCDGCKAEFFDADGNQVNCDEGLSKCQMELKTATERILESRITANMMSGVGKKDKDMVDKEEVKQYIDNIAETRILSDNVPARCQKMPETGNCKGFARRWFYDANTKRCSMFIWGMCGGNDNRFKTPEECFAVCNPTEDPCARTKCPEQNPKCTLLFSENCYAEETLCTVQSACTMDPRVNLPRGVFVPRCLASGKYSFKQCHGRNCWCVNAEGEYNGGFSKVVKYNDLQCEEGGPTQSSVSTAQACSDGSSPRPKCIKACNNKVCPGHPEAQCQVDLCSNKCTTKFVDDMSNEVQCVEEKCKAFSFAEEEKAECKSKSLCDGKGVKTCPSNVCDNAKCESNPCALCSVDPCTCEPYFIDMMTKKRVPTTHCKSIKKGVCHMKTCDMLHKMEEDKLSGIEVSTGGLPDCDTKGRYKPKQCDTPFDCYCVKEDGSRNRKVVSNGVCEKIKRIRKVKTNLSFNGDFYKLSREDIKDVQQSAVEFFMKLLQIGRVYIVVGEPSPGSIVVPVDVTKPDDADDMVAMTNQIQQAVEGGNVEITAGSQQLTNNPQASSLTKVESEDDDDNGSGDGDGGSGDGDGDGDGHKDDDDDGGLSKRDVIIIAAVAGAAGLALIVLVCYCCCCKERKKAEPVDDTFHHQRQSKASENIYDKPDNVMYPNKGYQPDENHYSKMRL